MLPLQALNNKLKIVNNIGRHHAAAGCLTHAAAAAGTKLCRMNKKN
jgi:hypothetical protein